METNSRCWPWKPFFVETEPGHLLRDAEESSPVGQVFRDPSLPHLSATGCFGLHDRVDLAATLGLPLPSSEWPDGRLILHCFAKWGIQTPEHLDGQFSFVIQDSRERRVFASVDHLGSLPPLYRWEESRLLLAGDMPTMLRSRKCPRRLNARALFTFGHADRLPNDPGETLHEGIYAVPPAHSLVAHERGLSLRRYWRLEIKPELVPSGEGEVYQRARQLVESAVGNRIEGKDRVAVMFSGGLDSSALVVTAANYLKRRGKSLLAICAVNDPANAGVVDERPFMEKLRHLDNVEFQYVDAAGRGPFDEIDDPGQFETTARLPVLGYLFKAINAAADAHGSDIVLNGGVGEYSISGTPTARFLESAIRLGWSAMVAELRATARIRQIPALRLFSSEVKHYYGRSGLSSAFFFNPDFGDLAGTRPRRCSPLWPDSTEAQLRALSNSFDRGVLGATLPTELAVGFSKPLWDKNLLEYCLAVPNRFKSGDGYGRLMIRKAFDSVLPKELAWRKGKIRASPDYNMRFNAQLPKAIEFVGGIRKSDPVREIVDVEALGNAMRPLEAWSHSSGAIPRVPETVNLINFLRQFPAFEDERMSAESRRFKYRATQFACKVSCDPANMSPEVGGEHRNESRNRYSHPEN
jgi:asparagine synthase (glutamine-hydrolysing)